MDKKTDEIIGLVPAAGQASRIAPLPCSKELFPVGFLVNENLESVRPKVTCHYLLEKLHFAGIRKVFMILRDGKWDIPSYLGDGSLVNLHLAYLMMAQPFGVPYTLDQAYPFVKDCRIALGFPDVLFESQDAFEKILDRQKSQKADVVLGLFPSDRSEKVDMVDVDGKGHVQQILIKSYRTHLTWCWAIAVWTPVFTQFIHDYVMNRKCRTEMESELFIGEVVQAGLKAGLKVQGIPVSDKPILDIGTPEDLRKAAMSFSSSLFTSLS